MARDTRASAAKANPPLQDNTSNTKRKRNQSKSPPPQSTTSLKVILPSPASIDASPDKNKSPNNAQGDQQSPKRQRIHLKISNVNANGDSRVVTEGETTQPKQNGSSSNGDSTSASPVKQSLIVTRRTGTILSEPLRTSLQLIISQMAVKLPSPLNGILSLWLPPKFTEVKENTLGYLLQQDDLTWESLVDTLHIFCENLLTPCSYPNPFPALQQLHLPVPPLPARYPPHAIYNFCASLYVLIRQIEPSHIRDDLATGERWALMQKTPGSGPSSGDWFTNPVDMRAVKAHKDKVAGSTLLEDLASKGDRFGSAVPVSMQSALSNHSGKTHTLADSVMQRASLKMSQWKREREKRQNGYFGSIRKGVTSVPRSDRLPFTPSFAPTYDSTNVTGGMGFYDSWSNVYEHSWHRHLSPKDIAGGQASGWHGTIDSETPISVKGKEKSNKTTSVDALLDRNIELIEELREWQEERVKRSMSAAPTPRETLVAEHLLDGLSQLATMVKPSDLLSSLSGDGMAHDLASRIISVSTQKIRGTLDPRRPHALHDNSTIRNRPPPSPALATGGSSEASPYAQRSYPSKPNYPAMGVTARLPMPSMLTSSSAPRTASPAGMSNSFAPYSPSPVGNTIYSRSAATARPPMTGRPSNLRQMVGPPMITAAGASNNTASIRRPM